MNVKYHLFTLVLLVNGGMKAQTLFDADFDDTTSMAVTDPSDLGSPLPAGAIWEFDNGPAGGLSGPVGGDRAAVFPHRGNAEITDATEIADNAALTNFDPIVEAVDPEAVGNAGGVQLFANFSTPISVDGTTAATVNFDWGTFGNSVTGTASNGGFKHCYCRGLDASGNEVFKLLFVSGNGPEVRQIFVQGADDDTVTVLGSLGIPAGDLVVESIASTTFQSTNVDSAPVELVEVTLSFSNSQMMVGFNHGDLAFAEDFDELSERVFGLNSAATEISKVEFTPVYNRFVGNQNKGFWLDDFRVTSDGASEVFSCDFNDAADQAFTQGADLGTVTPAGAAWSFRNGVAFGGNSVAVEGDKAVAFAENGSVEVSTFLTEWPANGPNEIFTTLPDESSVGLDSGSGTVLRSIFSAPGPVFGATGTQISFDYGHYGTSNLNGFKCGVVSGYSSSGDQVFEMLILAGSGDDSRRIYARGGSGNEATPPDDFDAVEVLRGFVNPASTNVGSEPDPMIGVTITISNGLVRYEVDSGIRGTIGNVFPINSAATDIESIEFNYVWRDGVDNQNKGWWLDNLLVEEIAAPAIPDFDAWPAGFAIEGTDVSIGADDDGDHLTTEEEYAYNGNPGVFTGPVGTMGFAGKPQVFSDGEGGYEVHFVMRNGLSLDYYPQTSEFLDFFEDYFGALDTVRVDGDSSVMSFPLDGMPRDFGRVEIVPQSGFSIDVP